MAATLDQLPMIHVLNPPSSFHPLKLIAARG
jgi:hypothetical protein